MICTLSTLRLCVFVIPQVVKIGSFFVQAQTAVTIHIHQSNVTPEKKKLFQRRLPGGWLAGVVVNE